MDCPPLRPRSRFRGQSSESSGLVILNGCRWSPQHGRVPFSAKIQPIGTQVSSEPQRNRTRCVPSPVLTSSGSTLPRSCMSSTRICDFIFSPICIASQGTGNFGWGLGRPTVLTVALPLRSSAASHGHSIESLGRRTGPKDQNSKARRGISLGSPN